MTRTAGLAVVATLLAPPVLTAQASRHSTSDVRFGICVPARERGPRAVGCFIITDTSLGALGPEPVFWHVTELDGRLVRPDSSAGTRLRAYGKTWLLTIADSSWRPTRGIHHAAIGPLPIVLGTHYSAMFMEASMRPGTTTPVHRHSGVEAWFTLQGETCLETPAGATTGRAQGPPVIVPAGLPMRLTATGRRLRRSLVLILHNSEQPPTTMDTTWVPRGLCDARRP